MHRLSWNSDVIRAERIAQPSDAGCMWIAFGVYHVESARRVRVFAMFGQEQLGGMHQLSTLARVNRSCTAPKGLRLAVAHFHEDQRVVTTTRIEHHQVQLAAAIVHITCDLAQAGFQQGITRGGFRLLAARVPIDELTLSRRRLPARCGHR